MPPLADDQVPKTVWNLDGDETIVSQYEQLLIFGKYVVPENSALVVKADGQFKVIG